MIRSYEATCNGMRSRRRYTAALRVAMLTTMVSMIGIATALAAAGTSAAGDNAGRAGETASAHWVTKKLNFVYQGFTTHYSCDGLEERVRDILLQLGARNSDMRVRQAGCTRPFGRPEPAPMVVGTFSVLEPAAPGDTEHVVKAAWHTVNVRVGRPGRDSAGQCELIEQVKSRILPLFAARDVQFSSSCVPHQAMIRGSTLTVQVLKAAEHSKDVAQSSP